VASALALALALALAGLALAACSSAPATSQIPSVAGFTCGQSGIKVATASQLRTALLKARSGQTLLLAPGTYAGNFSAATSGTSSAPITLCGPRNAVLDGGDIKSGYAFHLDHASWWRVEGFSVQGGQKGVVTDTSDHDLIFDLYVHGTGDEAIHLRAFSSYDTVSHNVIRDTGLYTGFFGEGIYVGSANANWCRYTACKPDESNFDDIVGNNIADTTAENIDIKEGTSYGKINGNQFDGVGMNLADATSWVNVKGNFWTISDNTGIDSDKDGFSDHEVYPGWGMDNAFESNSAAVNGPGYGFYVQHPQLLDVVFCSNKVTGARSGFANLACTPGGP